MSHSRFLLWISSLFVILLVLLTWLIDLYQDFSFCAISKQTHAVYDHDQNTHFMEKHTACHLGHQDQTLGNNGDECFMS
ncbi:hypothetical protein HMPREF3199_00935 [Enterococcus faecium]|nr:hypothetical protein HMPREF3199_00935 [Enterococcus faecium]